jgi:hypothetical protein
MRYDGTNPSSSEKYTSVFPLIDTVSFTAVVRARNGCTNLWYRGTEVSFHVQKNWVTWAIFKKYLQCVLAARILTVDFVVCTLAVKKKNQSRFWHVGSDHSLVRLYHNIWKEVPMFHFLLDAEIDQWFHYLFFWFPALRVFNLLL